MSNNLPDTPDTPDNNTNGVPGANSSLNIPNQVNNIIDDWLKVDDIVDNWLKYRETLSTLERLFKEALEQEGGYYNPDFLEIYNYLENSGDKPLNFIHKYIGLIHKFQGKYDEALKAFGTFIDTANEQNQSIDIMEAYWHMQVIHYNQGGYQKVLAVSEEPLLNRNIAQDTVYFALTSFLLWISYKGTGDHDKAKTNLHSVLLRLEKVAWILEQKDPEKLEQVAGTLETKKLNRLTGDVHAGIARINYGEGQYEKAGPAFDKVIAILQKELSIVQQEAPESLYFARLCMWMADKYDFQRKYEEALTFYKQAIPILAKLKMDQLLIDAQRSIHKIYNAKM